MMEVKIYATDVDDLKKQLIRYANVYGINLAEKTEATDTAADAPAIPSEASAQDVAAEPAPAQAPEETPKTAKTGAKRGPKPKAVKAEEAAQAPAPAAVEASEEAAPAEKPLTVEDARAALNDVSAALGIASAKALVNEFGASRVSDVKPEQFAQFVARAKELVAQKVTA